ncbi:flagellar biosynthesis protein FlgA [Szabonella alba]|uniref:Flagellar biosynthesis protein FlgA n=1 Tax=Szabonella alba TaxID=2804194 RepID=A0A8K0VHE3_9RHOB|nr:flagellar biosynthesis protein FlgA [Szabonella alba]MBL4919195.1 flagellar biosynthesis protein FlgA [Szabonella alba]
MHYGSLLEMASGAKVRVALIGLGDYGRSLLFQSLRVPGLEIVAVCDADRSRAETALRAAGLGKDHYVDCANGNAAASAIKSGKIALLSDGAQMTDLPVDVVVEATGHPDAAAHHAALSIANGKHVVMVSKEADSVVGPLLAKRAAAAGVVYTPVDGDQPSLLIQLALWARVCGLDILSAAKSSEYDFVFDPAAETVTCVSQTVSVPGFASLWGFGDRSPAEVIAAREAALADIPQRTVADLTEMGIVANALGLEVDRPDFHAPVARTQEIPDLLVPGGLLSGKNRVDVVNLLRRPDEFSLAGGVFVTVACEDSYTWEFLREKGHLVSRDGKAATIANPVHLLGVQSATTILLAGLQKRSSGTGRVDAKYDLQGRAKQDLKAGTLLTPQGRHHEVEGIDGFLAPAAAVVTGAPIPFHMMCNHRLRRDVAAGQILTLDDVDAPASSPLWELRAEMDRELLAKAASVGGGHGLP